MRTAIMTDTNSGISIAEGRAIGVFVLPMPVIIGGKDYLECLDISHEDLYKAILQGTDVSTSQPSPGSLIDAWSQILQSGYDELVYIPMSSGLSSTCATAKALAADFEGKVHVANSQRISVTLHDSVLDAKGMADEGYPAAEITAYLEKEGLNSSIYIAVNSLDLLRKSGRVTASAAAIATVMHIKPILTIQGGKLDSFSKARGLKHCEHRILEAVAEDIRNRFSSAPEELVSIGAAGTFQHRQDELAWLTAVKEAFPGHPTFYNRLSCSIACHVGVDAIGIGVCVLRKPR